MNTESDHSGEAPSKASTTLRLQEKRLTGYLQGLDLRKDLMELLDKGYREIVVDMADVELISSSIIGTLVGVNRDFWSREARLVLCNVCPTVLGILTTTGVDQLFKIRDA